MSRRRRGLVMLGLAVICAGLAASSVDRYADDVAAQVGPLRPVVVARRDLPRGTLITSATARYSLALRHVPMRFAPPNALHAPGQAAGYRTLTALAAGDYVSASLLGITHRREPVARRTRGRLVELAVSGATGIAPALRPGAIVDVLITTEGHGGAPRTYLALQRLELVDFRHDSASSGTGDGDATATVRVTLRQAVTLTAAQNFAREVRLVPRARGDMERLGPTAVGAQSLGR
jgi:pilus assembly protein CpaB